MSDTSPSYRLSITDMTQPVHERLPFQMFDSLDEALAAAATYPPRHPATIHELDDDGRPVKWYGVNMQTGRIAKSGIIPDHVEEAS